MREIQPSPHRISPALPWIFWGLGAAFYCYGFFQRVAPSVMVSDLMRDFGVSAAILGNLTAFYFYAYAGLQLPVGVIVDRWGPRRVLAIAAVLCGFGSLLFATAESLTAAYLGRFLIGAGAAFTWVGTLKIAAVWFPPHRFALISGMTLMLGMGGAIGGQAPLAALVESFGWRQTLIGASVFALALGALLYAVLRDGAETTHSDVTDEATGLLSGLKSAVKGPQTWIVGLFGMMMTAPMLAFGGLWGVPYIALAYDVPRPTAAMATSMLLIGWAVGAPLMGWASDRIGRRKTPMIASSIMATLILALAIYLPGVPLTGVFALLFLNGLFSGSMVISFAASREHNRPGASGAVIGVVNMMVMASGATFQPLIGWILDLNWDGAMLDGARVYSVAAYHTAFLTLLACGVTAFVSAVLVRETFCRQVVRNNAMVGGKDQPGI
ncbi:MAG: MFS transporter [Rhodospirillales bacterium]|nr:MFS transporter [Rhodospirillales bacterium]MCW8952487.1 MFS transporter [Rhodospirillales bacterium]MCW8969727.1 MFS transporter [Rhodospirillales bacterium]MCW9003368.1 MFS transporter [Rhodospirillales bacterium]